MKKSVLLMTTGGTIASRMSEEGLRPGISTGGIMSYVPGLNDFYDVSTRELLSLDSTNIRAEEWIAIARAVYEELPRYDGIVITHGTDTMAYTAAALSYMLRGLRKPVVLTGSQVPIYNLLTDARNNLYTAFAAVQCGIPGVTVAFDRKVISGVRAVKVRTMGFEAFESVNASYLGEVFSDGLHAHVPAPAEGELSAPVTLLDNICSDVFLLKLTPGTRPDILGALSAMGYRGVVIEAFGAGGIQFVRSDMMEALRGLTSQGISVVVCTQCLYEPSDLSIYEVGTKLLSCGVISAGDMTTEATVTKLMWALGQTGDPDEVRRIFATDFCGEIRL